MRIEAALGLLLNFEFTAEREIMTVNDWQRLLKLADSMAHPCLYSVLYDLSAASPGKELAMKHARHAGV